MADPENFRLGNAINANLDEFINFCKSKNNKVPGGRLTKLLAPFMLNSLVICCLSTEKKDEMDSFESLKAVQACYTKEKLAIQRHINRPDQEAVLNKSKQDALNALEVYFLNLRNFQANYPDHREDELVIESLKRFTFGEQKLNVEMSLLKLLIC